MSENVYFMGVSRRLSTEKQRSVVVASYSHNSTVHLASVKEILDQSNISMTSGKIYNMLFDSLGWHFSADNRGLVYTMICHANYPTRCVVTALQELERLFVVELAEKALSVGEGKLDKFARPILSSLCQKYDNLMNVDKISAVSSKIESVKLVMDENIRQALANTVKMDDLADKAEDLAQAAGVFDRGAKELRRKMLWKKRKMQFIIALIVLIILGIIVGLLVAFTHST